MKYIAIIVIFICLSCNQTDSTNVKESRIENSGHFIRSYHYNEASIPEFFKAFITNHLDDFILFDGSNFNKFCLSNNIDSKDSLNIKKFSTIGILHRLITSKNASNGSVGDIINIPYYWHWVSPNPRYEIFNVNGKIKLKDIKTPNGYSKYNSFADIDRTPYIFLSDLFSEHPKYYGSQCDSFSTFGWCSEREMAFINIMDLLGYQGKIIVENNHSWSLLKVSMLSNTKESKEFQVKVDNTFDKTTWSELTKEDISQWNSYYGNSKLAKWYNSQAHSEKEKSRVSAIIISPSATQEIEAATVKYLQKLITQQKN